MTLAFDQLCTLVRNRSGVSDSVCPLCSSRVSARQGATRDACLARGGLTMAARPQPGQDEPHVLGGYNGARRLGMIIGLGSSR